MTQENPINIIIVDDHAVVRRGIRLLLEDVNQFHIIEEASEGKDALEKCKRLNPDIVISDISMPGISGLELSEALRVECPKVKVLLLTMHQEAEYVIQAFKSGVYGYLHKGVHEDEIISAIVKISKGTKYYNSEIAEILTQGLIDSAKVSDKDIGRLTKREKEILKQLVDGFSNKQIAFKLFVSTRTIDTHRANIMSKLQVHNTAALVKYAISNKLID